MRNIGFGNDTMNLADHGGDIILTYSHCASFVMDFVFWLLIFLYVVEFYHLAAKFSCIAPNFLVG